MSKLELFLVLMGSVSINLVLLDQRYRVLEKLTCAPRGNP